MSSFCLKVTGCADGVHIDIAGGYFGHGDLKVVLDLAQHLPPRLVMDEANAHADAAKVAGTVQVRLRVGRMPWALRAVRYRT